MTNMSYHPTAPSSTPLWDLLLRAPQSLLHDVNANTTNITSLIHGQPDQTFLNTSFGREVYRTATLQEEGREPARRCDDWQDAQHTLFQLANVCVAVSFLTPASFRFHVAFLRGFLLLAFLLFLLWGGLFMCMADVLGWNLVFTVVNCAHIVWLLYTRLPASLPSALASLYTKVR